jgi:hypothetical protein
LAAAEALGERDPMKFVVEVRRLKCRGDPRLAVIAITRRAA